MTAARTASAPRVVRLICGTFAKPPGVPAPVSTSAGLLGLWRRGFRRRLRRGHGHRRLPGHRRRLRDDDGLRPPARSPPPRPHPPSAPPPRRRGRGLRPPHAPRSPLLPPRRLPPPSLH